MTITKGLQVTDLVSRIAVDLSDPNHRRWSADQITKFINEGLRDLADGGAFIRHDLHVASAGVAYYETLAETLRVVSVQFDGKQLRGATNDSITRVKGTGWRTLGGEPTHYIPDRNGIRLCPTPSQNGEGPVVSQPPPIDEETGSKIDGDNLAATLIEDTVVHFSFGDSTLAQTDPAAGNIVVTYHFYPRPSTGQDSLPLRYVDALSAYALWRCFALSQVPEEVTRSQLLAGAWQHHKATINTWSQHHAQSDTLLFAPMEAL